MSAAGAVRTVDRVANKRVAAGIMVPYVETEGQAREAVSFMRCAPEGVRGVAGGTRASDCGFGSKAYCAEANGRLLTVARMGTQLAVAIHEGKGLREQGGL